MFSPRGALGIRKVKPAVDSLARAGETKELTGEERLLIGYYREFMRLAKYMPKLKYQTIYKTYVKKFLQSSTAFLDKRTQIMAGHDEVGPLNKPDLIKRIPKTLAFVQRASIWKKNELHSTIFKNMIKTEESKAHFLEKRKKNDPMIFHKFNKYLYHIAEADKKNELEGLREMDRTVMRLNESEKMCL